MFESKGRTTLITGGLSGIGKALACEAAKNENHVVLVQRRSDESFNEELQKLGAASCHQLSYDLCKIENIENLYTDLQSLNLDVDILINNAGMLTGGILEEQDPLKIQSMLTLNLTTPILLTRKLLPNMLKRKSGKIVNNCSVTARIALPGNSTYGASKSGLLHFSNGLRQELRDTGVSVLALLTPGVKTEMFDDIHRQFDKNMDTGFLTHIPAEQWAQMVWSAIGSDKDILWPKGPEKVAVFLSTYLPSLMEGRFDSYFHR